MLWTDIGDQIERRKEAAEIFAVDEIHHLLLCVQMERAQRLPGGNV